MTEIQTSFSMPAAPVAESPFRAVLRVVRRPRAWVLYYLLTLIPSLVAAPLWVLPLLLPTGYPLFREMLSERSLDGAIDFLAGSATTGSLEMSTSDPDMTLFWGMIWILGVLCLILLIWPLLGAIWVWLEGGALESYRAGGTLSWRAFRGACNRWFGPLIGVNVIGVLAMLLLGGGAIGLAYWAGQSISWLGWGLAVPAVLLTGALATWTELARAAMVVKGERNLWRGFGAGWQLFLRRPQVILGLTLGALGISLLLMGAGQLLDVIPYSWWVLIGLLQQGLFALRLGVRLAREAGQVAAAEAAFQ